MVISRIFLSNMKIILRHIELGDLEDYFDLNHPDQLFHQFNGPYFKKNTIEELTTRVNFLKEKLQNGAVPPTFKLIADASTNQLIGEVSKYWRSKETNWMEIGVVIFDETYWGKGIGKQALTLWINELFETHQEIVRIGLSTWSGNTGMVKLSESLGLNQEACYRKARIVDGKYYDSVSYGILREEWE